MATCLPFCINRAPWPSGYQEDKREEFLKKYQTTLFEAYGAVMKEYVTVPDSLLKNTKELQKYLEASYQYAQTLKPKPTKKKS